MEEKNIQTQETNEETKEVKTEQKQEPKSSLMRKIDNAIAWGKAHQKELIYMGIGGVAGFIFGMRYGSRSAAVTGPVSASPYTNAYRYSQPSAGLAEQIALGLMKEALK